MARKKNQQGRKVIIHGTIRGNFDIQTFDGQMQTNRQITVWVPLSEEEKEEPLFVCALME
jgi:hypothetical protein